MKSLRKFRLKIFQRGDFKKYVFYSVGEILLVVLGILIAFQIDNWNERRLEGKTEREILEGIRNDILIDTIELNFNIRGYQKMISNNQIILDRILNKRPFDPLVASFLMNSGFSEYNLTLRNSHFAQAKQNGLAIIKDGTLRDRIIQLYEFKYSFLLNLENDKITHAELKSLVLPYLEIDSKFDLDSLFDSRNPCTIDPVSYAKLLADQKLATLLLLDTRFMNAVLNNDYLPTRDEALNTAALIDKTLKRE